jgi:hypothetical protein
MIVRIRFRRARKTVRTRRASQRLAAGIGALLPPLAFTAGVLAVWRIAADLKMAGTFAISTGLFSHWQVWLLAAILLGLCARALNQYGKNEDRAAP